MDAYLEQDPKERLEIVHEGMLLAQKRPDCHERSRAGLALRSGGAFALFSERRGPGRSRTKAMRCCRRPCLGKGSDVDTAVLFREVIVIAWKSTRHWTLPNGAVVRLC